MATSGVQLVTVTAKAIIQEALELLGVLGEGELATADQEISLLRTLNTLCVTWQADGMNLFAMQKGWLFLQGGRESYSIPDLQTRFTSSYVQTTLVNDIADTDTILTVTDDVGIATSDFIGIYTEGNFLFWTTVVSAAGNVITLSDPITADALAGATVFSYKQVNALSRPMKVLEGYVRIKGGTSIPVDKIPRDEYYSLSDKSSAGIPLQMYYDPQRVIGNLYVWPTASSEEDVLQINIQRQLDTAITVDDDIEYPAEWFLPLSTSLALIASAKHGLPRFEYTRITDLAQLYFQMAQGFDTEWGTSIEFAPEHLGTTGV